MNSIFTANENTLTLHIRITKKCNADCSYCSSFEKNAKDLMSLENLQISLNYLKDKILELNLGGARNHLSVQYIGGELLSVPLEYLEKFSLLVKDNLSPLFKSFKHGGQSNLIGSNQKVETLYNIFEGNLGTSFDSITGQRTIQKSSEKYKTIFIKNVSFIKKTQGINIPGIIVLDKKMSPFIHNEIEIYNKNKNNLTIRPVFDGGSPVEKLSIIDIENIFSEIYDNWFLKSNIIIEPFYSYFIKRFSTYKNKNISQISGCPSQHNCANVSINLEPDGSIFICQDLADSKQLILGNAITNDFNYELFNTIKDRSNKLNSDCLSCSYFKECQGGCMKEALDHTEDMYGKTLYCSVWKILFNKIDQSIANNNEALIINWINKISKEKIF